MSNYVKATNFATKDTLPTGDSNKIVKGTELDNEFNSIAGAVSSKADIASPTFTGTPAAPTATVGSSTTQIATTAFVTAALQALYPVGSIYINSAVTTNPATLFGFGTWTEFGSGKVLVGLDAADTLFDSLEETGGSKNAVVVSHTHTATSTSTVTDPGHNHQYIRDKDAGSISSHQYSDSNAGYLNTSTATTGITVATTTTNSTEGVSGTNANVQPFIVVKMWKRTA